MALCIRKIALPLIFAWFVLPQTSFAEEADWSYLDRELEYLMMIWPGDFDNQEQISLDQNSAAGQIQGQGRFHAVVTPVKNSDLGDNAVYLEISMDGDLNKIYQQRVLILTPDKTANAIRATSYVIKNASDYLGAGRQSDKLSQLQKRDLNEIKGCDILLRRDDDSFYGENDPQTCAAEEQQGHLKRSFSISANNFSFNDERTTKQSNEVLSSTIMPRKMRRARWFACMIDVPKNTPNKSDHTQHYIKIHDQGGTYGFTHPDGRAMTLLMRNTWSYGMQRETFFIGVLDGDVNGKTLVYAWGTPGSDRIGVNPGFVRIQCDLDQPGILELQQGLRPDS